MTTVDLGLAATDLYCGMGGSATGLVEAGFPVRRMSARIGSESGTLGAADRDGAAVTREGHAGYRYHLTRDDLVDADRRLVWIMLNPSTADATTDDPTIRRVRGFTRGFGFGAFTVVNLYGLRATHPRDLWVAADPVGPGNDAAIIEAARAAAEDGSPIVAAWGANARPERVAHVLTLPHVARDLRCLGVTASGAPRHPLYVRGDTRLIAYAAAKTGGVRVTATNTSRTRQGAAAGGAGHVG